MNEFLNRARSIADELITLRREFHRYPERGNKEFATAERIEAFLDVLGLPHRRMLDTAVVARLEGGRPGPTAALRADMDALPLTEATGVAYASQNPGVMHACGHDVHMTAVLGAALLLTEKRQELPGSVVFLFQPDEEGFGGARRLIEAGALKGVDAVFGAHVAPDLPSGTIGIRYGKFYAASDTFSLVIHGKSAHGAMREKGIDALGAAAELTGALIRLPEAMPTERCVVNVGVFHAGTVGNIVADQAILRGIIRTLGPEARRRLKQILREKVDEVMAAWGTTADVDLRGSYPGVVNDEGMTCLAERAIRAELGDTHVRIIESSTMISEDFGEYLTECPGSFYHIGAGCALPLHSAAFLPDDNAVVTGAAVHAAVIETFLRSR